MRLPSVYRRLLWCGDRENATIFDTSLSDNVIGEMLHILGWPLECRQFHAVLVVEMHVQRGERKVMMAKGLGAVYLQNGICLLPKTDDHLRRLKIIENEIAEMEGESVLLETVGLDRIQEEKLIARFDADRNEAYQEFLERCAGFEGEIARESAAGKFTFAELEENDEDLKKLRSWLEKIRKLDFHGASLADEAGKRLAQCEALLDAYAQQVFDAQDENRPPSRTGKSS